jgi:hypothetical protein
MMYQLLVDPIPFEEFKESKIGRFWSIDAAIQLLSSVTKVPMNELCVILLIDGLEHLPHTTKRPSITSKLYNAISTVANVVNACPAWVIAALSSTISEPFDTFLHLASQRKIYINKLNLHYKYEIE